ncbi:MAG: hypothetical protein WCN21_12495 [Comamonadaceae bacterium]
MMRTRTAALALTAVLSACGGGHDVPVPIPTPATAQVSESNHLDAAAVGKLAANRILEWLLNATVRATEIFVSPGVEACSAGGTATVSIIGDVRKIVFNACQVGQRIGVSGSVSVSGAVYDAQGKLQSSDVAIVELAYQSPSTQGVTEVMNGSTTYRTLSAGFVDLTGQVTVTRNARTDTYTKISSRLTANGVLEKLTVAVDSPRFPYGPLQVTDTDTSTVVIAPDGSRVTLTDVLSASSVGLRFDLRLAEALTPYYTRTLGSNDPLLQEAVMRAMK